MLGDAIHATAWDKIQLKEAEMNRVPEMYVEQRPQQPPVFTTHLQSHDRLTEQQSVHLEATVEPKTDPNLRVEWSKNGVPLMTGQWRGGRGVMEGWMGMGRDGMDYVKVGRGRARRDGTR